MLKNAVSATLVGFLPKETMSRPDWLGNDKVEEICSVSEHVSKGPSDLRRRNSLGLYDSEDLACEVISEEKDKFHLYAYKLVPLQFDEGEVSGYSIPFSLSADLGNYTSLGYDAANRSWKGLRFECSALSCNRGAKEFVVNRHCLFPDYATASEATKQISNGHYEPGPWYILEVLRKQSNLPLEEPALQR